MLFERHNYLVSRAIAACHMSAVFGPVRFEQCNARAARQSVDSRFAPPSSELPQNSQ
jgi:hypothetical protein